jgi:hypothetical protein
VAAPESGGGQFAVRLDGININLFDPVYINAMPPAMPPAMEFVP